MMGPLGVDLPIVAILVFQVGLEHLDLTRVNESMYPSAQAAASFCWLSVRK